MQHKQRRRVLRACFPVEDGKPVDPDASIEGRVGHPIYSVADSTWIARLAIKSFVFWPYVFMWGAAA